MDSVGEKIFRTRFLQQFAALFYKNGELTFSPLPSQLALAGSFDGHPYAPGKAESLCSQSVSADWLAP